MLNVDGLSLKEKPRCGKDCVSHVFHTISMQSP